MRPICLGCPTHQPIKLTYLAMFTCFRSHTRIVGSVIYVFILPQNSMISQHKPALGIGRTSCERIKYRWNLNISMLRVSKSLICRRFQLGTARLSDNYVHNNPWNVDDSLYNLEVHNHLLHRFMYHFNANRFTVPQKQLPVVSMVRFAKKLFITLMLNRGYVMAKRVFTCFFYSWA